MSRFDAFDSELLADFFAEQLQGIETGAFAREWSAERPLDRPGLKRLYEKYEDHPFFEAERETMKRLSLGEESEHDGRAESDQRKRGREAGTGVGEGNLRIERRRYGNLVGGGQLRQ